MITLNDGRKVLYQWDTGRIATVDVECDKVHFSNTTFGKAKNVDVVDGQVTIPDELLTSGSPLLAWAFVGDAEQGFTKKEQKFDVIKRAKPSDYVFTPTDQITLDKILQKMGNLDNLHTVDKSSLVNAINEVHSQNSAADSRIIWVKIIDDQSLKANYKASEIVEFIQKGYLVIARAFYEELIEIVAVPFALAGVGSESIVMFSASVGNLGFVASVDDEANVVIEEYEVNSELSVKTVNNIHPTDDGNINLTPEDIGSPTSEEFDSLKTLISGYNSLLQNTLEGVG